MLVVGDMGDDIVWWWWSTSDGFETGVSRLLSDKCINGCLLILFKNIPLFVSCLVVDSFIESLFFLDGSELCELVEDREGLLEKKEDDESVPE